MNSLDTNNDMSYNVRWNSFGNEMRNILSGLLESGKGSDLRVICNGEQIKCHSFVLRGCSEYFNQLLSELEDEQPHSHSVMAVVLQVDGVQFPELLDLINFMYKGEITVPVARLPLLIKSAQILKVKGLTDPVNFEWSSKNQCETSVTGNGHPPEGEQNRQELSPSSSDSASTIKADEESLNDVNPNADVMLQLQFLAYLNFAYRFLSSVATPSQSSFPNNNQLQLQQPPPPQPLKPPVQRKRRQSNKLKQTPSKGLKTDEVETNHKDESSGSNKATICVPEVTDGEISDANSFKSTSSSSAMKEPLSGLTECHDDPKRTVTGTDVLSEAPVTKRAKTATADGNHAESKKNRTPRRILPKESLSESNVDMALVEAAKNLGPAKDDSESEKEKRLKMASDLAVSGTVSASQAANYLEVHKTTLYRYLKNNDVSLSKRKRNAATVKNDTEKDSDTILQKAKAENTIGDGKLAS